MSTQTDPEELVAQIYGYGVAVITAALMIFLIYAILEVLIGQLPAQLAGLLISLGVIYAAIVNRKLRQELLAWLR